MTKKPAGVRWRTNFLAIVRYELIWNIRKKKFLGVLILAFVFATLVLFLRPILNDLNNVPTAADPAYVVTTGIGIGSIGFFLFALVSVMNSISGEFESGSILPLLTKPVSRTTIYLGKIFAAFLTILGAFILLIIYIAIGGSIVYGPQNNLYLLSITLLGSLLSTLVWMGIIMAIGSVSKNSMLAALLGIGIWLGINIASGILAVFPSQAWVLTYAPGNGATATLTGIVSISNISISSVRPSTVSVIAVKWTDAATSLIGAKGIFQSNLTGYLYSTYTLTSSWYNVTLSLPSTSPSTIFWQEQVNDSLKNVGTTSIESFTVTNGPPPVYQISLAALNSTSTGTDGISTNLITYILHPNQGVTYYKIDIRGRGQEKVSLLSSEPLYTTVSRSIVVAVIYIFVFNLMAWFALKRAQVAE